MAFPGPAGPPKLNSQRSDGGDDNHGLSGSEEDNGAGFEGNDSTGDSAKSQQGEGDPSDEDIVRRKDSISCTENVVVAQVQLDLDTRLGARIMPFRNGMEIVISEENVDIVHPFYILLTSIEVDGRAAMAGLQICDRLVAVDNEPIDSFYSYDNVLVLLQHKRPVLLTFSRYEADQFTPKIFRPKITSELEKFLDDFEIADNIGLEIDDAKASDLRKDKLDAVVEIHEKALLRQSMPYMRKVAVTCLHDYYRPLWWRLLLKNLPLNIDLWSNILSERRAQYEAYKNELMGSALKSDGGASNSSRPLHLYGQGWWETDDDAVDESPERNKAVDQIGDSLPGDSNDSEKEEIENDLILHDLIWKDVQRTHPGLHFFAAKQCETMERILFIYAKLNPGIRYIQGMNEILAPILFVYAGTLAESLDGLKDTKYEVNISQFEFSQHYEADAFFSFCNLMGDLRDFYMKSMDGSSDGINGRGSLLMEYLEIVDVDLHHHMIKTGLEPHFFAFRWITTLLSREMSLLNTIRLWDHIFARNKRIQFLLYVCCAMLTTKRDLLLRMTFSECLILLQKYPETDIMELLKEAELVREKLKEHFSLDDFSILERRSKAEANRALQKVADKLKSSIIGKSAVRLATATSTMVEKSNMTSFFSNK